MITIDSKPVLPWPRRVSRNLTPFIHVPINADCQPYYSVACESAKCAYHPMGPSSRAIVSAPCSSLCEAPKATRTAVQKKVSCISVGKASESAYEENAPVSGGTGGNRDACRAGGLWPSVPHHC